jgi:hypothetical protein
MTLLFKADAQETVTEKFPIYLFNVDENISPVSMLRYVVTQTSFFFQDGNFPLNE